MRIPESSDANDVIELSEVTAHRGTTRDVLQSVSLSVQAGETVAIQGVSGSGKTTLLAVVAGLLTPFSGTVAVAGTQLVGASDRVRSRFRLREVGFVFQADELVPELTLAENVSLPLRLAGVRQSERETQRAVSSLLTRLDIDHLRDRLPDEVSGGQLQRASLARAIVHRPAVLLADEPTASLDEGSSAESLAAMHELASEYGAAILLVTHDESTAQTCKTGYLLEHGRLVPKPLDGSSS